MNTRKILAGTLVWTIGLGIPLLYHRSLISAAVQEEGYRYSYTAMVKHFFELPWIIWVYLVAMGIVGACLVVSGMKDHADQK